MGRPRIVESRISWRQRDVNFKSIREICYLRENIGRDAVLIMDEMLDIAAANKGLMAYSTKIAYTAESFAKACLMYEKSDVETVQRTWGALVELEVIEIDKKGFIRFINEVKWFFKPISGTNHQDAKRLYMQDYRKKKKLPPHPDPFEELNFDYGEIS